MEDYPGDGKVDDHNFEGAVKLEAPSCSNSAQKIVPRCMKSKSKQDAGLPAKRRRTTLTEYADDEPASSSDHVALPGASGIKGSLRKLGHQRYRNRIARMALKMI